MNAKRIILIAALTIVAAGCILSAQWSLSVPFDVAEPFVNGVVKRTVDLAVEDGTWNDHKDNIDQIEKVGFDAIVVNSLATTDTLDMYLSATSSYSTRAAVLAAADTYPLLLGYVVPVGTDTLTRVEADALLQLSGANFTNVKNLVKTGNFTAYITSSGGAAVGQIDTANVYVTFTASK